MIVSKRMLKYYSDGFRQTTPTTCGPASVILSAFSLGLDAKEEFEWQAEKFAPWMPVKDFPVRGMALHELQFISELLYSTQLEIMLRRSYPENYDLFLNDLKEGHHTKKSVIIVNYRQDDFVPTQEPSEQGNPHYSPVLDWDITHQRLLIADVDSEIQEPYWVKTQMMFQSMSHSNPAFKIPRGWLVLRKRDIEKQPI